MSFGVVKIWLVCVDLSQPKTDRAAVMQAAATSPAAAAMACTALSTKVLLALTRLVEVLPRSCPTMQPRKAAADASAWQTLQPKLAGEHTEEYQKAADMVQEFMLYADYCHLGYCRVLLTAH